MVERAEPWGKYCSQSRQKLEHMQFYSADKACPKCGLINPLQPGISLPGEGDVVYDLINDEDASHTDDDLDSTSASTTSLTSKASAATKPSRAASVPNAAPTKYDRWQRGPGETVRQESMIRDRNRASDVRRPHAGEVQGASINENPKLKAQHLCAMQVTIVAASFEESTVRIGKRDIKRKEYGEAVFFSKLFIDPTTHLLTVQPN
jgi:hypothetical protein